jgi:hypothetical protein
VHCLKNECSSVRVDAFDFSLPFFRILFFFSELRAEPLCTALRTNVSQCALPLLILSYWFLICPFLGSCGAFVHGLEDECFSVRVAAVDSLTKLSMENHSLAVLALDFLVDMFNDEIEQVSHFIL